MFVSLSACLSLSFSSNIWLESGSQFRDGVGVEVVDLGLSPLDVGPGSYHSQLSPGLDDGITTPTAV